MQVDIKYSYILSHAINILYENFWVTEMYLYIFSALDSLVDAKSRGHFLLDTGAPIIYWPFDFVKILACHRVSVFELCGISVLLAIEHLFVIYFILRSIG